MVAVIVRFVGSLERHCMSKISIKYLILMGMVVGSLGVSAASSGSSLDPSTDTSGSFSDSSDEDPMPCDSDYIVYDPDQFSDEKGRQVLAYFDQKARSDIKRYLDLLNTPLGDSAANITGRTVTGFGRAHFALQQINMALYNIYREDKSKKFYETVVSFFDAMQKFNDTWADQKAPDFLTPYARDLFFRIGEADDSSALPDKALVLEILDYCMNFHFKLGRFKKGNIVQLNLQPTQAVCVLTQVAGRYCFEVLPQKRSSITSQEFDAEMHKLIHELCYVSSYKAIQSFYAVDYSFGFFLRAQDLPYCDPHKDPSLAECKEFCNRSAFWHSLIDYNEAGLYPLNPRI